MKPLSQLIHRAALPATLSVCLAILAGCTSPRSNFDPHAKPLPPAASATTNVFTATPPSSIKPEWLQPPTEPFRLGPGDKLELELLGRAGTRTTTFVCPDGKMYFDLLPGMDVWGLTLAEVKEKLEAHLGKYYTRPQVSLTLTSVESKRVWVLGRLNKSGIFPLTGPTTIIESISRAGGLFTSRFGGSTDELADLNHSFIIRNGEMLPINFQKLLRAGDTTQNIYVQPDDFIYLPSSLTSQIYVLGAVNGPRPIGFVDDMTLTTALAKALGTAPQAHLKQVAVVRGSLSEPKIAIVDFNAIVTGAAPDIRLQPRDIVYVPASPYRTLDRYAKLITDAFVRTVAANAGGQMATPSFGGVAVTNPVGN